MGYKVVPLKKKCYKCGEPMAKWIYDGDCRGGPGGVEVECSERCYMWFDEGMKQWKPKKTTLYSALRSVFKPVKIYGK